MSKGFKGIECDQCGVACGTALRLKFLVQGLYTYRPKGMHPVEDVYFYANFCGKECMRKFLDKYYFESKWEVTEDESGNGGNQESGDSSSGDKG